MSGLGRLKVGPFDRIILENVEYRWLETDEYGHVFDRVGQPGAHKALTHADLSDAVMRPGYGYDPDFYAPSRAKAMLRGGAHDISYLPRDEQARIMRRFEYALRFVQGEETRGFTRSDKGWSQAARILRRELEKAPPGATDGDGRVDAKLPAAWRGPSGRTLRRNVEDLEKAGWNPIVLRRNTHKSGNGTAKVDPRVAVFLQEGIEAYLRLRGPTKAGCLEVVHRLIQKHNERATEGDRLSLPSQTTLNRRIAKLPKGEVMLAREGIETTESHGRALSAGLDVRRAGQRVEIDHWSMPLMVLLRDLGLDGRLTKEEAKKLKRKTVVVCIVFDRASRCVLGLSMTDAATTDSALCALELAVSPKDEYAAAVGVQSGWPMRCTPESVVHDGGSEFISVKFRDKVLNMRSMDVTTMSAKPNQRAGMERLNGSLGVGFLSELRGRTFENPVRRGNYDSEAEANVLLGEARDMLLEYILNVYQKRPHTGLGGRTPEAEWHHLVNKFQVAPPPDRHLRRHVFGMELTRVTGPHGVTVLGLQYTSLDLQRRFRDRGPGEFLVRADPLDLGAVSIYFRKQDEWLVLACRTGGFDGVSMTEWEQAARRLQRQYGREAAISQSVLDATLDSIRAKSERHLPILGLGSDRPTAEYVKAVERSLQIGFVMPSDRDGQAPRRDLLTGGLPCTGEGSLVEQVADIADGSDTGTPQAGTRAGAVRPDPVVTDADVASGTGTAAPSPGSPEGAAEPQGVPKPRVTTVERRDAPRTLGRWRNRHDG